MITKLQTCEATELVILIDELFKIHAAVGDEIYAEILCDLDSCFGYIQPEYTIRFSCERPGYAKVVFGSGLDEEQVLREIQEEIDDFGLEDYID
ncbi:hypothetical protein KNT86_gp022 [Enterobacteria phage vB_EcoM_IME341]|uniref:Uncharacterized protein n=1 Tax=Enterobacteria phage vB_EcoM_IME341 TaxID=2163891 RepID=A0A2S1GRF2_9CAUD|nr:hypothetical protein KNT86_gp022 [Enterobacteria phage vB_EcoM_IME341]AWD91949.1 hypothetical protein [Enterobacteria phage vB_EcoM_IME341]